jgi:hypothetical protein
VLNDALIALQSSDLAGFLRQGRWSYAAGNTAHVLGIALLVGAIVPLDLRLIGLWPGASKAALTRVLAPMAALGLVIAASAGMMLLSVRATEYAALWVVQAKLALIALGLVNAVWLHMVSSGGRVRLHGALSLAIWLAVLISGRMIAFVEG